MLYNPVSKSSYNQQRGEVDLTQRVHVTPEQEKNGYTAESRFFKLINSFPDKPAGFLSVTQASALLDARGIDGFIVGHRGRANIATRIPIQLKTARWQVENYRPPPHLCDVPIQMILIHVDMYAHIMMRKVGSILADPDVLWYDFEPHIQRIESQPTTPKERGRIKIIEQRRARYALAEPAAVYVPQPPTKAPATFWQTIRQLFRF